MEDVDAAQLFDDTGGHGLNSVRVRDVAGDADGADAVFFRQFIGQYVSRVLIEIDNSHVGAVCCQPAGDACTLNTGATGHQRCLARKIEQVG